MTEQERFEAWLTDVCERPLPKGKLARAKTLARELAEGVIEEFWDSALILDKNRQLEPLSDYGRSYHSKRWRCNSVKSNVLRALKYVDGSYHLSEKAFNLLDEAEPATIFISYSRDDSSAFALLVLSRLKQHGLEAFLDMALQPGEDWHAGLKERIQQYDYFVVLLGKETLKSEYVRKEILWALEANLIILPIWHNGFEYNRADWPDLEPEIDEVLRNRHTIRVIEENALAYDGALTELLNRFGVTPE